MVYDFIQERIARSETGSVDEAKVVPASMSRQPPAQRGPQTTLKPADFEPAWQGAMPRRESVPLPRPRKQPV
jgi:hypothetical protein